MGQTRIQIVLLKFDFLLFKKGHLFLLLKFYVFWNHFKGGSSVNLVLSLSKINIFWKKFFALLTPLEKKFKKCWFLPLWQIYTVRRCPIKLHFFADFKLYFSLHYNCTRGNNIQSRSTSAVVARLTYFRSRPLSNYYIGPS